MAVHHADIGVRVLGPGTGVVNLGSCVAKVMPVKQACSRIARNDVSTVRNRQRVLSFRHCDETRGVGVREVAQE